MQMSWSVANDYNVQEWEVQYYYRPEFGGHFQNFYFSINLKLSTIENTWGGYTFWNTADLNQTPVKTSPAFGGDRLCFETVCVEYFLQDYFAGNRCMTQCQSNNHENIFYASSEYGPIDMNNI